MLHAGDVPDYPADLAGWDFRVFGEVEAPLTLAWDELDALPRVTVTQDIHCVTRWSRFDATFTGIPWSALAERLRPRESAHYAIAHSEAGYTANVPIGFLEREGAMLATHADGESLTPEQALRLIVPGKYFWKSAKWLRGMELRATDAPGSWERSATRTTPIPGTRSATRSEVPRDPSPTSRRHAERSRATAKRRLRVYPSRRRGIKPRDSAPAESTLANKKVNGRWGSGRLGDAGGGGCYGDRPPAPFLAPWFEGFASSCRCAGGPRLRASP